MIINEILRTRIQMQEIALSTNCNEVQEFISEWDANNKKGPKFKKYITRYENENYNNFEVYLLEGVLEKANSWFMRSEDCNNHFVGRNGLFILDRMGVFIGNNIDDKLVVQEFIPLPNYVVFEEQGGSENQTPISKGLEKCIEFNENRILGEAYSHSYSDTYINSRLIGKVGKFFNYYNNLFSGSSFLYTLLEPDRMIEFNFKGKVNNINEAPDEINPRKRMFKHKKRRRL